MKERVPDSKGHPGPSPKGIARRLNLQLRPRANFGGIRSACACWKPTFGGACVTGEIVGGAEWAVGWEVEEMEKYFPRRQ